MKVELDYIMPMTVNALGGAVELSNPRISKQRHRHFMVFAHLLFRAILQTSSVYP